MNCKNRFLWKMGCVKVWEIHEFMYEIMFVGVKWCTSMLNIDIHA
jgi:hypothetical protein